MIGIVEAVSHKWINYCMFIPTYSLHSERGEKECDRKKRKRICNGKKEWKREREVVVVLRWKDEAGRECLCSHHHHHHLTNRVRENLG